MWHVQLDFCTSFHMFISVRILNETNVTWKEDENKQNKVHARGYSIYSAYTAYMSTRFVDTDTIPPGNGFFCQKKLMLRRSQTFFNLFLKNKKNMNGSTSSLTLPPSLPPPTPVDLLANFHYHCLSLQSEKWGCSRQNIEPQSPQCAATKAPALAPGTQ